MSLLSMCWSAIVRVQDLTGWGGHFLLFWHNLTILPRCRDVQRSGDRASSHSTVNLFSVIDDQFVRLCTSVSRGCLSAEMCECYASL